MKIGDYLTCKVTYYNENYRKSSIKRWFQKPLFIKNKKYKIYHIDDNLNPCYLLECELYQNHNQLFIHNIQRIFYTEQEIRKLKLKKLNKWA